MSNQAGKTILLPTAPRLEKLPGEIEQDILDLPDLSRLDRLSLRAACAPAAGFLFVPPFQPHELFQLEKETAGWPQAPLGCSVCRRLRPNNKFTDRAVRSSDRGRGGPFAHNRVCVDCGVKPDEAGHQVYVKGTYLKISNQVHVVCSRCNQVRLAGIKRGGFCATCAPAVGAVKALKKGKEPAAAKKEA
ncbi:MAG: hypothetical protein Q9191_005676, partial [Dirinaria sp. TL-2023a]